MSKMIKFLLVLICIGGIYIISIPCSTEFSFFKIMDQEENIQLIRKINNEDPALIPAYNSEQGLKIPSITHHIWLTSADKPQDIPSLDMQHIMNTMKVLEQSALKWQHILWVNDAALNLETIKTLNAAGMQINNVTELKHDILQQDITDMIQKNSFSEASDLIRYLALQAYGGIYNDTDYEMFKPIDNLMQYYDFIGSEHPYYYHEEGEEINFDTLASAFVAAKPAHPVIIRTVNLIIRNLHAEVLPDYIKYSCSRHNKIWVTTGPMVLTLGFFQENNRPGDHDIILKNKYLNRSCKEKDLRNDAEAIGCHAFNGSWYRAKQTQTN